MTRDELASHARNTLGYSDRMAQDLLDAYDLGAKAGREACAALLERTDLSGAPDNMKGWIANMLMVYISAIRMRSNNGSNRLAATNATEGDKS